MIPRFRPNLGWGEFKKIFSLTPKSEVQDFEEEFSAFMGQKYARSFSYGRMALYAFLKAHQIEKKEIILPAYTCIVMAHAIEESGNHSVFVDVRKEDLSMDFELLKKAISKETAAIVFTSLYGAPVNLGEVQFIKEHYPHIKIIQDCTHLLNGKSQGKTIAHFGDMALFGLGLSKPVTSVFGGMLTTNDAELIKQIDSVKTHLFSDSVGRGLFKRVYLFLAFVAFWKPFYSVTNFLERYGFIDYFVKLFDVNKIEIPKDSFQNLSSFEASIGRLQLEKFAETAESIQAVTGIYQQGLKVPKIDVTEGIVVSHYNILIKNRESYMESMLSHGIQVGDMYNYSLPELKPYQGHKYLSGHNYSQNVAREIVNLPLCVSESEARRIVELTNKLLQS
ncbi:hypothetical protein C0V70_17800 [Bacteriovorax stolpii]|uniref:Uncharacterized protein n=1 Tax=Bacteriovorax stolpii TaxID=960 RepID=A0A2K9NY11_BACTC|nr:DegT/DnrJ/EryC1/StrS family aminotransferase [Bacteriovorax stolpii]AUN99925.1 hypothetical protein C0V70_17800 [Bacteriovorax stolpii]TDP54181.1 dTDP-4-amino-4,6-dideoxygalactose transaminase [Bacteriovorax stolpii]